VIGDPCGKGRGSVYPPNRADIRTTLPKRTMGTCEVEVRLVQMHLVLKPLYLFAKSYCLSSQATVFMSQIQVLSFHVNRTNLLQGHIPVYRSLKNTDHTPFFIPLLDNLTVTQCRTSYQFGPSGPTLFPGSRINLDDMMPREKRGAVSVQAVTDPKWLSVSIQSGFRMGHQWFCQGSLGCTNPKRNHQPITRRQCNPDPDLAFQRSALRRKSFF